MADRHKDTSQAPDDKHPGDRVRWHSGGFAIVPHALIQALPQCIGVYAALAKYADNETREAFPAEATLAADLGCSERTIRRRIHELAEAGWIEVIRRGAMDSNLYVVHSDASDRTDLAGHDRTPVATHDRTPVADELDPPRTRPSEGLSSDGPTTKGVGYSKEESLKGGSEQTQKRNKRKQQKAQGRPSSTRTTTPKPRRETIEEQAKRMGITKTEGR